MVSLMNALLVSEEKWILESGIGFLFLMACQIFLL